MTKQEILAQYNNQALQAAIAYSKTKDYLSYVADTFHSEYEKLDRRDLLDAAVRNITSAYVDTVLFGMYPTICEVINNRQPSEDILTAWKESYMGILGNLHAYTYNKQNCDWVDLRTSLEKLPAEYYRDVLRRKCTPSKRDYKTESAWKAAITKAYNRKAPIIEQFALNRNAFIAFIGDLSKYVS